MTRIEESIPLAPLTTFKVGGTARFFVSVQSVAELQQALVTARGKKWPVIILAGGSNVIISDSGFNGLVIKLEIGGVEINGQRLTAGAGADMKELVGRSATEGLAGLEWAGGLPGSFGGAIRGNAGAFGGEIKDSIVSVTSVGVTTGQISTRTNTECEFRYRSSIFKEVSEVIVKAIVQLSKGEPKSLDRIVKDHIRYRMERHPMNYPNAGSVFKNTPIGKIPPEHLPKFKDSIKTDPFPVVPTARIIAEAGLTGLTVGRAQLSTKHSNYIVNLGGATASEIVELIGIIRQTVRDKFGLELELEQQVIPWSTTPSNNSPTSNGL